MTDMDQSIVNRKRVSEVFKAYVEGYNMEDDMIRLKYEHTFRVAELCEQIADSLKLSQADKDLAWLIGMLHDVGRFEQLKQFGTFIDAKSINHAMYGAKILFEENRIRDYIETNAEDQLIQTAVAQHSAYKLPENLDERTKLFCEIIRDADKIDILKVNMLFPLEEIYHVSTKALRTTEVTKAVLDAFYEKHAVLAALRKVPVDNVVGHISLTYELVFPVSLQIVVEQGYLEQLMNFASDNPKTQKQFQDIRSFMKEYMNTKMK